MSIGQLEMLETTWLEPGEVVYTVISKFRRSRKEELKFKTTQVTEGVSKVCIEIFGFIENTTEML